MQCYKKQTGLPTANCKAWIGRWGGLPRLIHVDNAKEFHSQALLRGCQEYGIALQHRGRRQPHLGGHIERLIGTMMGEVHLLPGRSATEGRGSSRLLICRCLPLWLESEVRIPAPESIVKFFIQNLRAGL